MDPRFGLDIDTLINCMEGKVLEYKKQVTGGVNFSFIVKDVNGHDGVRQCKPTVQKKWLHSTHACRCATVSAAAPCNISLEHIRNDSRWIRGLHHI